MNFKNQLLYHIKVQNLTAAELSRRSGVSKQSISDWLAGVQPRSIPQVKKVADVFAISVDSLCFGKDFERERSSRPTTDASSHREFARARHLRAVECESEETPVFAPVPRSGLSLTLGFDGRIRRAGDGFCSHFGWSEAELLHHPLANFVHISDRWRTQLRMVATNGGEHLAPNGESRLFCKSGEIRWVRWSSLLSCEDDRIHVACKDVSGDYPIAHDPLMLISPDYLARDAVAFSKISPISTKMIFHEQISSRTSIICRPAAMSSGILFLLQEAASCSFGEKREIHLSLLEEERSVRFEAKVRSRGAAPKLDTILEFVRESGSVTFERRSEELALCIETSKA